MIVSGAVTLVAVTIVFSGNHRILSTSYIEAAQILRRASIL